MVYLFSREEEIKKRIAKNFVYLFLDYDGTLTPIADAPCKALLPAATRGLLRELSKARGCKLAVISGRSLKEIKRIIGLEGVVYAGNHGLEIDGPKLRFKSSVPPGFEKLVKDIKRALRDKLAGIGGIILEDKGYTLSVHYRMVHSRRAPFIRAVFREATARYLACSKIKVKTGKMMLEVRPPVEWDKGRSVMWLLAKQMSASRDKSVMPVYIGDDLTDEDAFTALGSRGLTVFVGRPGGSAARYYLKDHNDVARFLAMVRELKRTKKDAGTAES